MAVKLLPCPFCGQKEYLRVTYRTQQAGRDTLWGVFCMEGCAASINDIYDTKEKAIDAWNTRTPITLSREGLARIISENYDNGDCFKIADNIIAALPQLLERGQ